ncbi:hypothetical protein RAM80_20980 [Pseudomonas sp. App30]|uniref:hypothetical protein n=1 Tax=Pseudomonas sp. App30 TaxID=3068990 RepID=UPI003A80AF4D
MQRAQFLKQPEVAAFVEWLVKTLPTLTFNLDFKRSKYVPDGLKVQVHGFENVLAHYCWGASWTDQHGKPFPSRDWPSTKASLARLRQWLDAAVASNNNPDALAACLEVLRWGGVRGAIPFLNRMAGSGLLVNYLQAVRDHLALDDSNRVSGLNKISVQRFDAGLTKIHALLDESGSPIYDSRVGAAIGMLHSLFRQQYSGERFLSPFPSGAARGSQLRNPGALPGGLPAPQFGTLAYEEWARWQLRLGWIIRAVLASSKWFESEGSLAERCHAFEASLFMIGYDLRCFGGVSATVSAHPAKTGWVPTGHPFSTVVKCYLKFRQLGLPDNKSSFVEWLMVNLGGDAPLKKSTASGYCFAFTMQEFDLFQRPLIEIQAIAAGGEDGLKAALGMPKLEPFEWSAERERVCLVDVWLTGIAYRNHSTSQARVKWLITQGHAGTANAASTLLALGRNVGRHFGLLGDDNLPTELFDRFFINLP